MESTMSTNSRERFLILRAVLRECGSDALPDLRRLEAARNHPGVDALVEELWADPRYHEKCEARWAAAKRTERIAECVAECVKLLDTARALQNNEHAIPAAQGDIDKLAQLLSRLGDDPDESTVTR